MAKRIVVLLLGLIIAASAACSPEYAIRAGIEEAKILSRRRPIPEVAADPRTAEAERRKLDLVLRARTYAASALDLAVGESYTTYSWVDRDTLLLVVSGAEQDRFRAHTWWFPFVGRVPYKGFFRFEHAFREAERLESRGYDSYVRPASAFSTLGWFNDPLLNTLLRADEVSLVSTVIHELTHNTTYLPGQAAFNESFANFVGDRGAIDFFCGIEGDDGPRCRAASQMWADNLRFGAFLSELVEELEALYEREDLTREQKIVRREAVFEAALETFRAEVQPALGILTFRNFLEAPLNNATLIGRRLYYRRLDLFEAIFQASGGDLPGTVAAVIDATEADPGDPYDAVEALLHR